MFENDIISMIETQWVQADENAFRKTSTALPGFFWPSYEIFQTTWIADDKSSRKREI